MNATEKLNSIKEQLPLMKKEVFLLQSKINVLTKEEFIKGLGKIERELKQIEEIINS